MCEGGGGGGVEVSEGGRGEKRGTDLTSPSWCVRWTACCWLLSVMRYEVFVKGRGRGWGKEERGAERKRGGQT